MGFCADGHISMCLSRGWNDRAEWLEKMHWDIWAHKKKKLKLEFKTHKSKNSGVWGCKMKLKKYKLWNLTLVKMRKQLLWLGGMLNYFSSLFLFKKAHGSCPMHHCVCVCVCVHMGVHTLCMFMSSNHCLFLYDYQQSRCLFLFFLDIA